MSTTEKCKICKKSTSKRSPGLECIRCSCVVHASTHCAGLTNKQLAALRATESLEWTCDICQKAYSKRGSIMAEDEDSEEDNSNENKDNNTSGLDIRKLLRDIAKEIKKEISPLTTSVEYLSDKMDEIGKCMEGVKEKLKDVEKRTVHLANESQHMKINIMAMEQRINELEQDKLCNTIEISGIPVTIEKDKTEKVVQSVAKKLGINDNTIKNIKASGSNAGKARILLVEMTEAEGQERWLRRAREVLVTVADVLPNATAEVAKDKVFIREALTHHLKNLLWKTKQDLRNVYKFIWCRNGKVLVRKTENERVLTVRSEEDIKRLLTDIQKNRY